MGANEDQPSLLQVELRSPNIVGLNEISMANGQLMKLLREYVAEGASKGQSSLLQDQDVMIYNQRKVLVKLLRASFIKNRQTPTDIDAEPRRTRPITGYPKHILLTLTEKQLRKLR
jgi:hypothetical protein